MIDSKVTATPRYNFLFPGLGDLLRDKNVSKQTTSSLTSLGLGERLMRDQLVLNPIFTRSGLNNLAQNSLTTSVAGLF